MQISILLGTIFGVVLNHVLPEIFLLVYASCPPPRRGCAPHRVALSTRSALGIVLGFTGLTSLRKGLAQRARHNKLVGDRPPLCTPVARPSRTVRSPGVCGNGRRRRCGRRERG